MKSGLKACVVGCVICLVVFTVNSLAGQKVQMQIDDSKPVELKATPKQFTPIRPRLLPTPIKEEAVAEEKTKPKATSKPKAVAKKVAGYQTSFDEKTGVTATRPMVIQIGADWCPACRTWMRTEKIKWTRVGWSVVKVDRDKEPGLFGWVRTFPSFRIYDGTRWYTHNGYLTTDDGKKLLSKEK